MNQPADTLTERPDKVFDGMRVKMMYGDRDRVGDVGHVSKIKPDGSCEISFGCDYCASSVSNIEVNPERRHSSDKQFAYWPEPLRSHWARDNDWNTMQHKIIWN